MPAMRSGEVLVYLQGPNERSKPVRAPPASRYSIEVFFAHQLTVKSAQDGLSAVHVPLTFGLSADCLCRGRLPYSAFPVVRVDL